MGHVEERHAAFQQRHRESTPSVDAVVAHLRRHGHRVFQPDQQTAPTYADRFLYRDTGDCFICIPPIPPAPPFWRLRIEVKAMLASTGTFTAGSTWPFAHYMVGGVHAFHHGPLWPFAIFRVNPARTWAGLVFGTAQPRWWTEWRRCPDGSLELTYMTDPDHVRFFPL